MKSLTHTLEPLGPPTGPISSGGAPRLCSGALRACSAAARSARVSGRYMRPSPCPSSTVRSRTGAGSTGKTAFTTTTGHISCTEGRHWSFNAGCGHDAEEGRDTASARRVLRRQASFEAAWPQLTATDCLHVSRLYRYAAVRSAHIGASALRAVSSQRAPRVCLASALRACVQLARSARVSG